MSRFRLHLGFVPMLGGLIGALGLLVLLQQAGSVYPTILVTVLFLLGGLLVGILLPSIAGSIARRRP